MGTLILTFLGSFAIGFLTALYGDNKGWGVWRILGVAALISSFFSLLVTVAANAGELSAKLKASTAHLANGTGFVVLAPSGKTYLVTNWHVCLSGRWRSRLTGSLETGEMLRGPIVKEDPKADLCAARIEGVKPTPLTLARSLKPFEKIYTRGYPYGVLTEGSGRFLAPAEWTYDYPIESIGSCRPGMRPEMAGNGVIAACSANYTSNITDLYSRPGSSGSPVVNAEGELVGVMSSWLGATDSGGMVRLEDLRDFVSSL